MDLPAAIAAPISASNDRVGIGTAEKAAIPPENLGDRKAAQGRESGIGVDNRIVRQSRVSDQDRE